jgi:hypothetical protein
VLPKRDSSSTVDLQRRADPGAVAPRLGVGDAPDLVLDAHRAVSEQPTEADEAADLVDVQRLAVGVRRAVYRGSRELLP